MDGFGVGVDGADEGLAQGVGMGGMKGRGGVVVGKDGGNAGLGSV